MKEVEKALDWVALNRASLARKAEEGDSLAAEILVLEQLARLDPSGSKEFPHLTTLFLLKVEMYHMKKK